MVAIKLFDWKCTHTGMITSDEGNEIYRWHSYHCPHCGFYYDDSMGTTLANALDYWAAYMLDLESESLSAAEQDEDRKFTTRQSEVLDEIEQDNMINEMQRDYLDGTFRACGYCGSDHCYGGCQLGGLG